MDLGVIILTGGRSSRMGADKSRLDWNGRSAVACLADLADQLHACAVVTVGPENFGLPQVRDPEVGGGPAPAIAAGLADLTARGCRCALVLAVDAPTIQPADVQPLLAAGPPGAAFEGLHLPFALDLPAHLGPAEAGGSVRRLLDAAGVRRLPPPAASGLRLRGANTPEERQALLAELAAAQSAQESGGD